MGDKAKIDPEFQTLLPPLSSDVYTALQIEILRDGCTDPVTFWEEEDVVLDGHHRVRICEANDILYEFASVSLPSRDAAKLWIIKHARARRNFTPIEDDYYRGVQYNLEKKAPHRPKAEGEGGQNVPLKTSEKLAEEHGVSEKTIKRDGNFATAVDVIAENVGPAAKKKLLASGVSKKKVQDIAKLPKKQQGPAVNVIAGGGKKKTDAKPKPKEQAKAKKKELELYDDCDSSFQQMFNRVKPLGRVSKEEFYGAIGDVTEQRWFKMLVDELHYMKILEVDGTCELFIDETELDLCTAIHIRIEVMRGACGKGNRFKFDLGLQRKVVRDLYDLARKASMHV